MPNTYWTHTFRTLYDKAVAQYSAGKKGADTYFDEEETKWLASIGLRPINLYDCAEDSSNHGEPDWETFLLTVAARRDYFLHEMKRNPASYEVTGGELPPKTDELEGIVWLPRIIKKAHCFLEGGLCHDIMYGCGGDRRFFAENKVHPADFLRVIWASRGDDAKVVDFVKAHRG